MSSYRGPANTPRESALAPKRGQRDEVGIGASKSQSPRVVCAPGKIYSPNSARTSRNLFHIPPLASAISLPSFAGLVQHEITCSSSLRRPDLCRPVPFLCAYRAPVQYIWIAETGPWPYEMIYFVLCRLSTGKCYFLMTVRRSPRVLISQSLELRSIVTMTESRVCFRVLPWRVPAHFLAMSTPLATNTFVIRNTGYHSQHVGTSGTVRR